MSSSCRARQRQCGRGQTEFPEGTTSKIYDALQRHEKSTRSSAAAPRLTSSTALDQGGGSCRDMQGLCHSIETALATVEGGVTIMFSSAHLKEGKTTVAGGLATTLASNFGRSVLIIDGDRQGVLHGRFAADDRSRLADVAQAPETFLKAAKRFGPRGSIAVVRTASLFESGDGVEVDLLIAAKPALNKVFDYILIDAPALAQVPWSPAIGKLTDGIVLVVEAERTRFPVVRHAKEEFENSGVKVLGVFLNKRKFYVPRAIYRFL